MIEANGLTRMYGEMAAIREVSFRVERGEIVGFLGRNGAGKSTTMRILSGSLGPSEGSATIAGFDVVEAPFEAKKRLGYLPEQPPLYLDMTVSTYLAFAAKVKQVKRARVKEAVEKTMDRTGLTPVGNRMIGNLSKGYRQRVGIAQALVHDPEVLVLDEPTEGLDPAQIAEIRQLVRGLRQDHTVILSTHILTEVEEVCDRVLIIDRGRIVAQDTLKGLGAQVEEAPAIEVRVARPEKAVLDALQALKGVVGVSLLGGGDGSDGYLVRTETGVDLREDVARTVVEGRFGLLEMRRVTASLEDIFLKIVRNSERKG